MIVDWKYFKLGEIADFQRGRSLSKSMIKEDGKYPCIHYGELFTKYSESITQVYSFTNIEGNLVYSKSNDVLMPTSDITPSGLAKASAVVRDGIIIGGDILIIRASSDLLSGNFLANFIRYSKTEILKLVTGSTVYHIYAKDLTKFKIPLPPLSEQQKIAEILNTVDEKIEVIDQQIIENKELKRGLMQRLLTKGIGHTEFKNSPLGEIPESWSVVRLSEICDEIFLGLTSKVDYVETGGFPFVRATDINSGRLSFENIKYISEKQHRKLTVNRLTKKGDVLVSKSGTLGTCAIVDVDTEFSTYESIITIQPKSDLLSNKFLLQILQDTDVQKRMIGARVGGIVGHLNLMTFRKLIIPLPELNEQIQISELLTTVDEKLLVLSEKKKHYQQLKQGLMQQLLTGKIRVKV